MKLWAVLLLLTGFVTGAAASESYPIKPLRLLVPFAAGSGVDALAQVLSKKLSEKLGQPIWVENRPGAGGVIAATQVAKAVPVLSSDLPGFESSTWYGLYGPKGLPEAITQKLNQTVNAVLLDKDIKASLTQLGAEATGGSPQTLAQRVKNDTDKWAKVVRERRIVID